MNTSKLQKVYKRNDKHSKAIQKVIKNGVVEDPHNVIF